MKKIISTFMVFLLMVNSAFAITKTPAKDITTTTSTFTNCLGSNNTDVQSSLNTIDGCFATTGIPGGISGNAQYNNGAGGFAGLPRSVLTSGGNLGIGTTAIPNSTFEVVKNSTTDLFNASTVGNHGDIFTIKNSGNIGIGTTGNTPALLSLFTSGGNGAISVFQPGYTSFKIDQNGTVGIGTASPRSGVAMDINGDVWQRYGSFNFVSDTTQQNKFQVIDQNSTVYMQLGAPNVGYPIILNSGTFVGTTSTVNRAGLFVFSNVGIGTYNNQNSALTVMSGNMGIGTWNPRRALEVTGGALISTNTGIGTTSPQALLHVGSGGDAPSFGSNTMGYFTRPGTTGVVIRDSTNDVEMVLEADSSGFGITDPDNSGKPFYIFGSATNDNVGIGSFHPGTRLDVQGTVRSTGLVLSTNPSSGYVLTSNSVGVGTWMPSSGSSSQWTTVNTNDVYLPNNGNVGLGTTFTSKAALTVMNGNVGIGTWVPSQVLDVKGNVTLSGALTSSSGTSILNSLQISNSAGNLNVSGSTLNIGAAASNVLFNGTGNVSIPGNVGIGTTTPQTKLSIVGGNVGIGTWTAGVNLSVTGAEQLTQGIGVGSGLAASTLTGNTRINAGNGTNDSVLFFQNDATTSILSSTFASTGAYTPLQIKTSDVARMTIDTNGNVGLGTVAPKALLQVVGNVGIGTNASSNFIRTTPPSGGMIVEGNVGIGTHTVTGGLLIVNGNGNVGIGTAFPGVGLDVNGTIRSTTAGSSSFTGNLGIGTTTPQDKLIIMGGNVGIGTWTPSSKLQVSGTCGAIGPVGACWTSTGQMGYCSGAAGVCTTCTAC